MPANKVFTEEEVSNRAPSLPSELSKSCIETYEQSFAQFVGTRRAIAFAYGRTALQCILAAAGLQRGDEIILSPLTCKVVPLALLAQGLKPVYAEISRDTLNLDARAVAAAIGPTTRAILFQHTYGSSAGVEPVVEITTQKGLLLIEDCAQCTPCAEGAKGPGRWGIAGIFSNNLRKPIPAGSGGLAVTDNERLAEEVARLRDQYPHRGRLAEASLRVENWAHEHILRPWLYWPLYEWHRKMKPAIASLTLEQEIAREVSEVSLRISERQARTVLCWLGKMESMVRHRQLCCQEYANALRQIPAVEVPHLRPGQLLFYFPVLVRDKGGLLKSARKKHLEVIAWPYRTPIYPVEDNSDLARYGYQPGSCPVAETVATRLIGLPTDFAASASQREAAIELIQSHHEPRVGN